MMHYGYYNGSGGTHWGAWILVIIAMLVFWGSARLDHRHPPPPEAKSLRPSPRAAQRDQSRCTADSG
jgi:hypothetical protein